MGDLTDHFSQWEFEWKYDGPKFIVDANLLIGLEKLRSFCNNTRIDTTSGARTMQRQEEIYKARYPVDWQKRIARNSYHLPDKHNGILKAVDIRMGFPLHKIVSSAELISEFGAIIYSEKDQFVHLDVRPRRPYVASY